MIIENNQIEAQKALERLKQAVVNEPIGAYEDSIRGFELARLWYARGLYNSVIRLCDVVIGSMAE